MICEKLESLQSLICLVLGRTLPITQSSRSPLASISQTTPTLGEGKALHSFIYNSSLRTSYSFSTNATLQAEAFQLWKNNRTGPLTAGSLGRIDQLIWGRLPSSLLNASDPSAGSNSAHYELALAVSSFCFYKSSLRDCLTRMSRDLLIFCYRPLLLLVQRLVSTILQS